MRTDFRHRIYPTAPTKSIKFRATFPQVESYGLHKIKEVVFALGLGPCGKHVLRLEHTVTEDLLTIIQTSRDPEDLEQPYLYELEALTYEIQLHSAAVDERRKLLRTFGETYTTGHLWWKKTHVMTVDTRHLKDLLTDEQKKANFARQDEIKKAAREWLKRLEVKTFVYKMSDVHGRIEVIQ